MKVSVMNRSVTNVVCYEQVCNERGLLWVVCIMNRSILKGNRPERLQPFENLLFLKTNEHYRESWEC